MILIGDKNRFAIESGITEAYERLSFLALGFFVIYIGGQRYGVHAPDATMLACSLGEVENRIALRGTHVAPFAGEQSAGVIADAYRTAIYAPNMDDKNFFGISQPEFRKLIYSKHLPWAPDGDEAFDDGSYVLQFDVLNKVRLIAFRSQSEAYHHDPLTLQEVWLDAGEYYRALEQWRDAFKEAWAVAPKISEAEEGTNIVN